MLTVTAETFEFQYSVAEGENSDAVTFHPPFPAEIARLLIEDERFVWASDTGDLPTTARSGQICSWAGVEVTHIDVDRSEPVFCRNNPHRSVSHTPEMLRVLGEVLDGIAVITPYFGVEIAGAPDDEDYILQRR